MKRKKTPKKIKTSRPGEKKLYQSNLVYLVLGVLVTIFVLLLLKV